MSITNVIVTGGSGRVGRYVLAELAPHFDVTNADLTETPPVSATRSQDVHYRNVDVMNLDALRAVTRHADAVVHLAAIDYDWKAAPEEYIRINTLGTWNVLQAASENRVKKVVLCSSISACGLSEMRPDWTPQTLQVDETHELRPVQAYSVSKQIMETMGLSVSRGTATEVICLRPLAVVLSETLAEYVKFIDDPSLRWLFYYIEAGDLARAFRAALEIRGLKFDTFFISAADTSRPEPTLEWYRQRIGPLPEAMDAEAFERNSRASIFSSRKAKTILGWEPTTDFLELRAKYGL